MKYAVVTGGTRGIGRAIANRLLKEDFYVISVYANNETAAEEFAKENSKYQSHLKLFKVNLSSAAAAEILGEQIIKKSTKIDVLVLNSAITDFTPFGEILPENWERVLNVNLTAPFFLIQKLAPFIAERSGRILLIGSYVAQYPHARSVSYGCSKAAIEMLARYLVKYFAERQITVNCISPGVIDTSWHDEKTEGHKRSIESKIALHRFGRPDEIAELCMEVIKNQYINGAILNINGGYSYQ